MKRTLRGLILASLLLGTIALVPLAQASPDLQAPDGVRTYRSDVPTTSLLSSEEISAYWTEERMAAAQPLPESVTGRTAGEGLAVERLVQADGPAMYAAGYNIGGAETAAVSATVGGSNAQTPTFTYPFAYDRTYVNIPILATTHGRLFFTNDAYGGNFVCSGASVTSGGGNQALVVTAAHCLHAGNNSAGGWSYNVVFVPATIYGSEPYGHWNAYDTGVLNNWYVSANDREDFGFVITDHNSNVCGALGACVGAQGLAWNQPVGQHIWDFAYPAQAPFPGNQPVWCTASVAKLDTLIPGIGAYPMAIGCDMTGGASGGAWMIAAKVANKGLVNSVNSYHYIAPSEPLSIYGPYFATSLKTLWDVTRVIVVP